MIHSVDVYLWDHVHTALLRGCSVGRATSHGSVCYVFTVSSKHMLSTVLWALRTSNHCELKATTAKVCCHVDLATVEHKHDLADC